MILFLSASEILAGCENLEGPLWKVGPSQRISSIQYNLHRRLPQQSLRRAYAFPASLIDSSPSPTPLGHLVPWRARRRPRGLDESTVGGRGSRMALLVLWNAVCNQCLLFMYMYTMRNVLLLCNLAHVLRKMRCKYFPEMVSVGDLKDALHIWEYHLWRMLCCKTDAVWMC